VLRLSRLFKSLLAVLLLIALAACATGGRSEQGQDRWFVANPIATQTGYSTVCADGVFAKASFPDPLLKEMAQTYRMHSEWINEVGFLRDRSKKFLLRHCKAEVNSIPLTGYSQL
jgi:hypothetical protein